MSGTYVEFTVTEQTHNKLNHWLDSLGLPQAKHPFHVTTVFSKVPILYITAHSNDSIMVYPENMALLFLQGNNDLGLCLCLMLNDPAFYFSHERAMNLGATWDYPTFIPHLTLTYNTQIADLIAKPIKIPNFPMQFLAQPEAIMELDADWRPIR